MFGKIQITGKIEVMTGMHIGTSDGFAAIGAVDSPVIRDAQTKTPMLPGSTLKGKLRTLLAKQYNKEVLLFIKMMLNVLSICLAVRRNRENVQKIVV